LNVKSSPPHGVPGGDSGPEAGSFVNPALSRQTVFAERLGGL